MSDQEQVPALGSVHLHKGDEVRVLAYDAELSTLTVAYVESGYAWELSLSKARRVLTPVPASEPWVLTHPSGATYELDLEADDLERMSCARAGESGHSSCGVYPCCGWPCFVACPCLPG